MVICASPYQPLGGRSWPVLWGWVLGLLLLALAPSGVEASGPSRALAAIGATGLIDQAALTQRLAIEQVYGNTLITPEIALIGLIQDALAQEVATRLGEGPSEPDIEALSRHADTSSQAPERLERVKAVFGEDIAAYRRVYLAPKVTERNLRRYHALQHRIHGAEKQRIEQAYRRVMAGQAFAETAKALDLNHFRGEIGAPNEALPPALQPYLPSPEALPKDPLLALLAPLEDGAIYPGIVEQDEAFQVVRRLDKQGATFRIETLSIAKRPFQPWFEAQAAELEVRILDQELARNIVARYPDLWWVKRGLER